MDREQSHRIFIFWLFKGNRKYKVVVMDVTLDLLCLPHLGACQWYKYWYWYWRTPLQMLNSPHWLLLITQKFFFISLSTFTFFFQIAPWHFMKYYIKSIKKNKLWFTNLVFQISTWTILKHKTNKHNFLTWQSMCLHNYFKGPAFRDRLSSICMIKLSRQNTADQMKNANTFRYLMFQLKF